MIKTKKRDKYNLSLLVSGTPAGARTLDTLIKSQVLYQLSYGCILFLFAGAKVRTLCEPTKLFRNFFGKKMKKGSKSQVPSLFILIDESSDEQDSQSGHHDRHHRHELDENVKRRS